MDKHIKRYILVVGLVAGVLWTAAGYVQAQEAPENPPFNKEEMKEKWKAKKEAQRLEGILAAREVLTPEQFSQMMEFGKEHRGKGRQSKRFHEDGEYGNGGGPAKTDAE